MIFFIISFVAGVLTVLTPCVLPMLPIVLGAGISEAGNRRKVLVIIGSLAVSIFIFTFALKVSTIFIGVPEYFWKYLSGGIIFIFGLTLLLPNLWSKISNSLFNRSNALLGESYQKRDSVWGNIAIGAALGPVFTTCSPTFFVILATVLPGSLLLGTIYLLAYILGLSLILVAIAILGQKLILRLNYLSDPSGKLKKVLGVVFVILAVLVATGAEKRIETSILNAGFFDFTKIERGITELFGANPTNSNTGDNSTTTQNNSIKQGKKVIKKTSIYPEFKYKEMVSPSGFVNTRSFTLKDIVGKKVILLDFMTYSCINCQRTFPYLNAWYKRYKDEGLEIVAIHTPEFAFEKKIENVQKAALDFGLTFPIVLDNDYATWNAYENQYWPHKYLIDINGNVVYDHVGEGSYDKTEAKIVELLKERALVTGSFVSDTKTSVTPYSVYAKSPETYFGAGRNSNFGNGKAGIISGEMNYVLPQIVLRDKYYLVGNWKVENEYAENIGAPVDLVFKFDAKDVYMVAGVLDAVGKREIEIYLDGSMINEAVSGDDVQQGKSVIQESRLYHLISLPVAGEHTIRIIFKNPNTRIYTFTFG